MKFRFNLFSQVIIQWLDIPTDPGVISWSEFLAIGEAEDETELNKRLSLSAINQCCTLIYTSGKSELTKLFKND